MKTMKKIKRIRSCLVSVLIGILFCGVISLASENVAIVQSFTNEDSISVFIKGVEEGIKDINIQIGTTVAEVAAVEKIKNLDVPMRTLVMVDNSLSISKDNRKKISLFLQDLISDRLNNEEIAIATFSEDITYLTEYTNDYSALKKAAESIVHEDLETYLTDVLYELLSAEYNPENEDIYHRIIVVSDGVTIKH